MADVESGRAAPQCADSALELESLESLASRESLASSESLEQLGPLEPLEPAEWQGSRPLLNVAHYVDAPPSPLPLRHAPKAVAAAERALWRRGRGRGRRGAQGGLKEGLRGPLRALRLCLLAVLLPGALVAVPLYLRFHVYADTLYPLAMSDMRLLDGRVSTTWCQRQVVRANATFNAFLLAEAPRLAPATRAVAMERQLLLEDDMKEYWAFYLLRGSTVTVSACASAAGASLTVIRGHRHLHDCAYIGDDSSEEMDDDESASRRLAVQRRARPGVQLLGAQPPLGSRELLQGHGDDPGDGHAHGDADADADADPRDALRILNKVAQKRAEARRRGGGGGSAAVGDVEGDVEGPRQTPSSSEVVEELLRKLRALGPRGGRLLDKLSGRLTNASADADADADAGPTASEEAVAALRGLVRRLIQQEAGAAGRVAGADEEDDEEDNVALEEEVGSPDGIADHHRRFNESGPGDLDSSNSEFWSSFSSSEEALLSCRGLVLNLPLHPHHRCSAGAAPEAQRAAAARNTLTYRVPRNGYYFFVFGSENEVQTNYLRAHFQLERVLYDVSSPLAACRNATRPCALPLDFFSSEKLVLELAVRANASLWSEEFVVVSSCEPRTALYVACVVAVPLLVVLFAFQ